MKKYILILFVAATFGACNNTASKTTVSETADSTSTGISFAGVKTFTIEQLLAEAENYVNKPVKVSGFVLHTCKHSGRRCFIANPDQTLTLRVEAKGKIGGFNRELVSSTIEVDGILRERRLSNEEIDNMEKAIAEKRIKDDGSEDACNAETTNVKRMRAWMKDHGKDYYALYYIDGNDFREVR